MDDSLKAYCKVKQASLHKLWIYDFTNMTFWKRQNDTYQRKIGVAKGLVERRDECGAQINNPK
jgi:hypothetical protein